MVRCGLATPTLFSLTTRCRAYESVDCVIFSVFRFDIFAVCVFFGGISGVSFLKLKLGLAFGTLNKVTHFSDSFVL